MHARRKRPWRHRGGQANLDIEEVEIPAPAKDQELLEMNDALEQFSLRDQRKAELVKLKYFVGLTTEEAAAVLGISIPRPIAGGGSAAHG
jgi:DNA-directed RNA polymerase specialized sigma24 family protein